MILSSHLSVSRSELLDEAEVKNLLTFKNPAFESAARFGSRFSAEEIAEFIFAYKEHGASILLPRNFPREFLNPASSTLRYTEGALCPPFSFTGSLRDYQVPYLSEDLLTTTDKILEVPCGHGKTVLALYLAAIYQSPTLVLVPTNYLAAQWELRAKEFTTAEVCRLDAKKAVGDWQTAQITIATFDLFNAREFSESFYNHFGHVVLDEAHRVGAPTYQPIIWRLPALHRTALSATFRREDGMHRLLKFHFGQIFKMDSRFPPAKVYPLKTGVFFHTLFDREALKEREENLESFAEWAKLDLHWTRDYCALPKNPSKVEELLGTWYAAGKVNKTTYGFLLRALRKGTRGGYSVMDNYTAQHAGRTKLLAAVLKKCLEAGRTVLFLSKRKDTLKALHATFSKKYRSALILGKSEAKVDMDFVANRAQVIFGIAQLANEGLDIERLDTLIFHLPVKDTEQPVGRIQRIAPGKKQALVFYPLDEHFVYQGVFKKAKSFICLNATLENPVAFAQVDHILASHEAS